MKPKIIAYYLPQFHEIPENSLWWGKGYTEWRNAKNAKPLFSGHYQPRKPLEDNYYDLLNPEVMEWQMNLARKSGISGFCFYHYWFGENRKLLEKPAELLLQNSNATLPFCFSWANEPWTRTWEGPGGEKHVLMNQKYCGEEDWKAHFMYLLPFFMDSRYIRKDNKPIFLIYRLDKIPCYKEMFSCWKMLAKENGLDGIYFIQMLSNEKFKRHGVDAYTTYVPAMFFELRDDAKKRLKYEIVEKLPVKKIPRAIAPLLLDVFDYDKSYQEILSKNYASNEYMGVFPDFDNTARKAEKAAIWKGATPKKFEKYMRLVINKSRKENKDFIFLTAWNEWGEGNYMEPDERYGYSYLKSLRRALEESE